MRFGAFFMTIIENNYKRAFHYYVKECNFVVKKTCMSEEKDFTEAEKDRIIEMAWEDRTPFEAIKFQFGLTQGEVEKFMRKELKPSSFRRWRKRVSSGVGVKHTYKAQPEMLRFKCTRQRTISMNKISKR